VRRPGLDHEHLFERLGGPYLVGSLNHGHYIGESFGPGIVLGPNPVLGKKLPGHSVADKPLHYDKIVS
jgi:hypothetical protein